MKVDLERLRRSLARYVHAGESAVPVAVGELEALVAVVDAARDGVRAWSEGAYSDIDCGSLEAALEPFGPERPDRAWKEVDRWNREQARQANVERDLAVKAAVDAAKPNPRDRARDQLADAGVAVQRQFRSDQERIAALEAERDEWKGRHKAVTNGLSNHVARADQAEERLARVPALVEAVRKAAGWLENGPPGELDDSWPLLETFRTALAEWEKP